MAAAPLSSPKKQKINEAGDRLTVPVVNFTSHNDGMESLETLLEDDYLDRQSPLDKLTALSRTIQNRKLRQNPNVTSRSDLPTDWRKSHMLPAITIPKESVSKFIPLVVHKSPILTGPNEQRIRQLLQETGYPLSVSARQRTYGPPPGASDPVPGKECQVFFGKMPKQIFEDQLVPLFAKAGKIYEMRIMMEGAPSVISRGFGFVVYSSPSDAERAAEMLDEYEILPGYFIKVAVSYPMVRLFICQIPKTLSEADVTKEIRMKLDNVTSVEFKSAKGVCFVTFSDHLSAAHAKKRIGNNSVRLFGAKVTVDFADMIPEPDEKTMSAVKEVFVKGFRNVSEDDLIKAFESCGVIEHVKKLSNYAFIQFAERSGAETAIEKFHEKRVAALGSSVLQVSLAKPQLSQHVKEEALIRRQKRLENQRKGSYSAAVHHFMPPFEHGLRREICSKEVIVVKDGQRFYLLQRD